LNGYIEADNDANIIDLSESCLEKLWVFSSEYLYKFTYAKSDCDSLIPLYVPRIQGSTVNSVANSINELLPGSFELIKSDGEVGVKFLSFQFKYKVMIGYVFGVFGWPFVYYFVPAAFIVSLLDLLILQGLSSRPLQKQILIVLGNFIWIITLFGFISFLICLLFGLLFCFSIFCLGLGKRLLSHSLLILLPCGRQVVKDDNIGIGVVCNKLGDCMWLGMGFLLIFIHGIGAIVFALSIVLLPLAPMHLKVISLMFFPSRSNICLDYRVDNSMQVRSVEFGGIISTKSRAIETRVAGVH
jgi:uncharacterized membrane protein YccF (DUF307 family)